MDNKNIVVGISGASGAVYGIRLLEEIRDAGLLAHLIVTPAARMTIALETDFDAAYADSLAARNYGITAIDSAIASGSFATRGMVVAPCSIKTASMIANSISDNLLVRAADVALKERRQLVLVIRETPIHLGHVKIFEKLILMGASILLPVPAFYHRPKTIGDIVDQTVGRVLDTMGIANGLTKRWQGGMAR